MAALQDILVPDIGDFKNVEIIEISVKPGDRINEDDPLITLESDKASMEVPSPKSGTVAEVKVAVGDRVSKGSPIITLEVGEAQVPEQPSPTGLQETDVEPAQPPAPDLAPPPPIALAELPTRADTAVTERLTSIQLSVTAPPIDEAAFAKAHASPSIRRLARELGVDLGRVRGSGPKGRILKEDVQSFVKAMLTRPMAVIRHANLRAGRPPGVRGDPRRLVRSSVAGGRPSVVGMPAAGLHVPLFGSRAMAIYSQEHHVRTESLYV